MLNHKDVAVIRKLAGQVAEIASLPVQEEKRKLWRRLNAPEQVRPLVMIDQVCWNEMNFNGELTLECADAECRSYEQTLRQTLFQWRYFPVDMVVEPFIRVAKAITNTGFGIGIVADIADSGAADGVRGRKFHNQFEHDEDIEKLKMPRVSHDAEATRRRLENAHELFDGFLEVRLWGWDPYLSLWDPISFWMGVEGALYAMMDRPEFMHRLLARMTEGYLSMLDQLQEQGLLCGPQSLVHCTGAYTDELPAPGYDPEKPRTSDMWMFGLAQMLSTVSPDMFQEFEIDYTRRICERFGPVYYGCCDPLDSKMDQVRMLPNLRKVSVSPWADQERAAAEIRDEFVFSRKPNPAFLAPDRFNIEQVRQDIEATLQICEKHGCPLEIILKDISTVHYEPERLFAWARAAMDVAEGR